MAVAIVAAGLVVYTLGGSPYFPCNTLDRNRDVLQSDQEHEEEMPIMLAMPGAAALSMAEPAADWSAQARSNNHDASFPKEHLQYHQ